LPLAEHQPHPGTPLVPVAPLGPRSLSLGGCAGHPNTAAVYRGPGASLGPQALRTPRTCRTFLSARGAPPPLARAAGASHLSHLSHPVYRGMTATILNGPPLPPLILIGRAKTKLPRAGNRSSCATFSNAGMFAAKRIWWVSKFFDCP
jgi:hypothetical protein